MTWMNQEQRALARREAEQACNEAYRKAAAICMDMRVLENPSVRVGRTFAREVNAGLESAAKAIEAEITE